MIDTVRGVVRVRKWPKKYGKLRSEAQAYWVDWFRQANLLAKYADGMAQARAIAMTKGSGLYPRDVMLKAMRGRLYVWADDNGWKWYPVAAIQDISESLDVLAQTIGSVLCRAPDRWRSVVPGNPGDVLTYQGSLAPPEWLPATGAGGFSGGCLAYNSAAVTLLNGAAVKLPFDGETYDTATIHDPVTNNTDFVVPSGTTWIRASMNGRFNGAINGEIWMEINGAKFPGHGHYQDTTAVHSTAISAVVPVVAGDILTFWAKQTSGATKTINLNQLIGFAAVELL